MNLDAWYQKRKGQSLLVPGQPESLRGQCVQAADYVLTEVYGLPYHYGNAADWWFNPGELLQNFDRVAGPPLKGDFVIWSAKLPGSGGYGHIDVCYIDGTPGGFTGIDSNWNGKTVHLEKHDYNYHLGNLRPKGAPVATDALTKEDIIVIYDLTFEVEDGAVPQDIINAYVGKPLSGLLTQLHSDPTWLAHKAQQGATPGFKKVTKELYEKEA